jgi:2,3,4,5-tetrahydropyridine-2-carboxylate N-succinyltransferase
MLPGDLQGEIEQLYDAKPIKYTRTHHKLFDRFKAALNEGRVRAAEPNAGSPTGWRVNAWVKKGILLGFRIGTVAPMVYQGGGIVTAKPLATVAPFFDKSTYPIKRMRVRDGVRVVPGGSSIRDGCYVGKSVTCMPPMFINAGAYVDEGTMVDSHALVGSCAQIGRNVHISAASQIGGVLEPVGALPVIVEDDVLVGGNCGIYEGTVVKRRAVLGTGTILNRSTPVYDLVNGAIHKATDEQPLVIPEGAVIVAGSRAVTRGAGKDWGISIYTPVIVKYRDAKTDTRIQLEDLLR